MGQVEQKDKDNTSVESLQRYTNFTLSDLTKLREAFEQEQQRERSEGDIRGGIDVKHFGDLLQKALGETVTDDHAKRLFSVFDKDKNGKIDFKEFVVGLSVCCRGTLGERIKFLFRVFDVDGDGTISREEMRQILTATSSLRTELGGNQDGVNPEDYISKVFSQFDSDHNNALDLAEFKAVVESNPSLLGFLGHDDGSLCYLVAIELVVPPTAPTPDAKDPETELRSAKRAINMAARLSKPRDKIIFFLSQPPPNMDHKPPFQPNKAYREKYSAMADLYKQQILQHVATVQREILDDTVQTNIWTKKGVMSQLMKGVCDESHADFLLIADVDTQHPEELATLVSSIGCSLIFVK